MSLKAVVTINALHPELDEKAHVTLAFNDVSEVSKFPLEFGSVYIISTVFEVVYWEQADVTVLLLSDLNGDVKDLQGYFESLGFTYNLEFIPHITVSKGDTVEHWSHMIGEDIDLSGVYLKIKEYK